MNLKERMKEEPRNEKKNSNESEKPLNTTNTTPKSNPPSQDLILQKQSETIQRQKSEIQKLTTSLQKLTEEGRPEDQETISKLSSQVNELKEQLQSDTREIQRLTDENVKLNDKIATLSESDKQLKEAKRLRKEASDMKVQSDKAVETVKKQAAANVKKANDERDKAIRDRDLALSRTNDEYLEARSTREEAEELLRNAKNKIKQGIESGRAQIRKEESSKYKAKYAIESGLKVFLGGIAVIFSVAYAIVSPQIRSNIIDIGKGVWWYLSGAFHLIYGWFSGLWGVGRWWGYPLAIIVGLGSLAIAYGSWLLGLYYVITEYLSKEERFDSQMRWVMVGTAEIAVAVSLVGWLPTWNLVLVFLSVSVISPLIRLYMRKKCMDSYGHFDGRAVKAHLIVIGIFAVIGALLWFAWIKPSMDRQKQPSYQVQYKMKR